MIFDRQPSNQRLEVAEMSRRIADRGMIHQEIDVDAAAAQNLLEIYNIVDFPAIAIARDDGQLVALWQRTLPTFDELARKYGLLT